MKSKIVNPLKWVWDRFVFHIFTWQQASIIFAFVQSLMIMTLWLREFTSLNLWTATPLLLVGILTFSYIMSIQMKFVLKLSREQKGRWEWYLDLVENQKRIETKIDRLEAKWT